MIVLTLPRLVSGPEIATNMVAALGNIRSLEVVVDARATSAGTSSFAARLVREVLVTQGAKRLLVVGAPADFRHDLETAADKLEVHERLDVSSRMPAAA